MIATLVIVGRINTEEVQDGARPSTTGPGIRADGGELLMKTLAIRLDDDLHAQLSVLAQLRDSSITDEIRSAIESHLAMSQHDEALSARAQAVLEDIERDAKARQAAIATLFGQTADQGPATAAPGSGNAGQRKTKAE